MPAVDYAHLADKIANEVAVPLGDIAVSEGFSGETAYETRKKTVEFLQHAQVLANNMFVLNQVLQNTQQGVSHYQSTAGLLDQPTMDKVKGNRDSTGTVWGRAISDEKMHSVQTGSRGILPDKKWIIDTEVNGGKITACRIAKAGDPGGQMQQGDYTDKYTILYPIPAELGDIYKIARDDISNLTKTLTSAVHSMPTIEKVQNGGEYGDMQYPNSIFSNLNGSFQTNDFDPESNFSKLKTNGRTDLENSLLAEAKKEEQRSGQPEEKNENTQQTTPTVIQTGGGGFFTPGGGGGRTSSRFPSSRDRGRTGNLRYKLNEVSGDDIYDQLLDKYGGKPGEGISFGKPGNSGTGAGIGSYVPSSSTLTPYTPGKYLDPSRNTYSYTPTQYEPIERSRYDFSTPTSYKSSDLGTTTSSFTPSSYTPSSYSSGLSGLNTSPSTYLTPASSRTAGTTIPSGQFNSMMDRLNNPIITRGASGMPGSAGSAGMAGRNGGTVSTPGASPMRENAATYRTGESAAGAQRGTVSGSGVNGSSAGGRGGMGMMPMMPMGGAGAPGAGGKGGKDNKKAQIKNQDGDLYGNDIRSVAPVISAGNKPAGMPQPKENAPKNEGMN